MLAFRGINKKEQIIELKFVSVFFSHDLRYKFNKITWNPFL